MQDPRQQELRQFEVLVEALFREQHPQRREEAHKRLMSITSDSSFILKSQFILEKSTNTHALMAAGRSLTNLVTKYWNQFTNPQRLSIRTWTLNLLHKRGAGMQHTASIHLIKLVCRLTKMGWFEDAKFRDLVQEVTKFLQHTIQNNIIGLKILNELVIDMNLPLPGQTPTNLRKAAVSFKERCLFHIFQVVMTTIKQIQEKIIKGMLPDQANAMKKQVLELGINVLAFDFIGTNPDESTSEVGTIQVPLAWRSVVQDAATMQLLFDFYGDNVPPHSSKCLELILYMASVRRSIFSNDAERKNFLARLMDGTRNILRYRQGINMPDNYHQFCRLLSKLKSNYQLADLVRTEGYHNWIELTANFTISSFQQYSWSVRSTHYLLQLWDRLISATPYVKVGTSSGAGHVLNKFLPNVINAYIEGRLKAIQAAHTSGTVEDPLENPDSCEAQLVHVPKLARYQYSEVVGNVVRQLDLITQNYFGHCQTAAASPQAEVKKRFLEGQLAWMTYIASSLVGGQIAMLNRRRLSDGPGEEVHDAELCKRVFGLILHVEKRFMSSKGAWKVSENLELAILDFMQNFRKAYVGQHKGMPALPERQERSLADEIGDQLFGVDDDDDDDEDDIVGGDDLTISTRESPKTEKQKAYLRMFEQMKLGEYHVVINMMVDKLVNNLRFRHESSDIISKSLALFSEFVTGYSSGRLMLRLDSVKKILTNHSARDFQFLAANCENRRHRSDFHRALSHLIWNNDGPKKFEGFIAPFVDVLRRLGSVPSLRSEQFAGLVVGACCDLRGIASAAHNSRTYGMLFESLYPAIFPTLTKATAECWDRHEVTTAIFKFMIEFVTNKVQRITFDHCSPNGILLFREASNVVCAYAQKTLTIRRAIDKPKLYKERYKGISLCLGMLTKIFAGRYVNFGVFELYKDPALRSALDASMKLAVSIPLDEMFQHTKVASAYYAYVEVLFRNHLSSIVKFDHVVFMGLIKSMKHGLEHLNVLVSSRCAASLDHLASFYFRYCGKERNSGRPQSGAKLLHQHISQHPQLFTELLGLLFRVVLFNDGALTNQWALGKPVLSIMLADDGAFKEVRKQLVASQAGDSTCQQRLTDAFLKLTRDIRPNLEQANRDQFSRKLNIFRREVMTFLKV